MPERMSESNPTEEESGDQASRSLEEEGDTAPRNPPSTGARLWDRVRGRLLRPKVKIWTVSCGQGMVLYMMPAFKDKLTVSFLLFNRVIHCVITSVPEI